MSTAELLRNAQFVVDSKGNKTAVVLDYAAWEELLSELEDIEDAQDLDQLRKSGEEVVSWEQAKAELRSDGLDV